MTRTHRAVSSPGLVFISHEKNDNGLAREIRDHLESGGFSCWLAPDNVRGPTPWPQQVEQAIEDCDVMLIVVSASANGSPHVSREVDLPVEKGKPLLPVRVEDIAPTGTLNYLLRLAQWIDLFPGSVADHAPALQGMVGSMLAERGLAPPDRSAASGRPRHPRRRIRIPRRAVTVLGALALVAAGVGIGVVLSADDDSSGVLTEGPDEGEIADDSGDGETTTDDDEGALPPSGKGTVTLVSVAADGTQGDDHSLNPSMSSDGRYVAFDSLASNLVDDDSGTWRDVFVHDRDTGETTRISTIVGDDGTVVEGNGASHHPRISGDGRSIVYVSAATNLDPSADETNGVDDLFLYDRDTGTTRLISRTPDGDQHHLDSTDPSISADGTLIAYATISADLAADEEGGPAHLYFDPSGSYTAWVHDTTTDTTVQLAELNTDQSLAPPLVAESGAWS